MKSPSEDIKDMLVADSNLGLTYGINLFIGLQPDSPKDCITIYDTPGFQQVFALDNNNVERPSIQIKVRSSNGYLAGYNRLKDIETSLHNRANEIWNGALYLSILASGSPAVLEWNALSDVNVVLNFNLMRR